MKELERKVHCATAICLKCQYKTLVYYLSGFLYGEGFCYTEDGKRQIYINMLEDDAYAEVSRIVERLTGDAGASPLRKVFGAACDPLDGVAVDFDREKPACSACGSDNLEFLPDNPQDMVTVRLPLVTHDRWNRLSTAGKEELIQNELNERK